MAARQSGESDPPSPDRTAGQAAAPLSQPNAMSDDAALFVLLADATDDAALLCDDGRSISYVNPAFTRLFGWTMAEVVGRHPLSLFATDLAEEDRQEIEATIARGETVRREEIIRGRDSQRCWASVTIRPVLDADGRVSRTLALIRDITTVKLHETLQQHVLEAMARDRPMVDVLDLVCREVERFAPEIHSSILAVDETGCMRPLAAPQLPASYCAKIDGVPIGPSAGSCGTAAYLDRPVIVSDIETDPLWADYRDYILPFGYRACWSSPIHLPNGSVVGTFALYFRERMRPTPFHEHILDACSHLSGLAMEREQARLKIRRLAWYDSLTGLPNRSLFLSLAEQAATEVEDGVLGVLVLNLDRFKLINELHGRAAGDDMLRDVARSVRLGLKPDDIVGRLSGDEFIAILREDDAASVADSVERLQKRLAAAVHTPSGGAPPPTVSVGIAMYPDDGRDIELLIQRADLAMHRAKETTPGSFCFFSAEMNALAQERLLLESALRQALRTGSGLELHYQPQVEMESGALSGIEALARWTHPTLGVVPPSRFIPLAEECGVIDELGRWALLEACGQLARWRAAGLAVPTVSVNLSAASLRDHGLPAMIANALGANRLSPADLTLEITESVLVDTHPDVFRIIGEIRALGVRLSLDDFGTGYSSLGNLLRLPIAEIKLDQTFVAGVESEESARALSEAVIRIGDSLRLDVIAEGVETETQRELLAGLGYRFAQGYLFARPLSADGLADWLGGRAAKVR